MYVSRQVLDCPESPRRVENPSSMKCSSCFLAQVALTVACQHEIHNTEAFFGLDERLVKRQEPVNFPPTLDENEAVLLGAIESTDLDEWSNYYAHK